MSTQVVPNGVGVVTHAPPTHISVTYKKTIDQTVAPPKEVYTVTVSQDEVYKDLDMPVIFENPNGELVKIVFLSPEGKETDEVKAGKECTLTVGGFYHYNCYFIPAGETEPIKATTGGTLDVLPHRP
ncbi:MAG TPA: hypothetical protein VKH81_07095 [Candidatus Angelobacter sp.]|nr:hypothetical protein [Candidatus Angelobacter sp.]